MTSEPGSNSHADLLVDGQRPLINRELSSQIYARLQQDVPVDENSIRVVGIDGPTAVGKTILAESLAERIVKDGGSCWIYQLDWVLAARVDRIHDVENLKTLGAQFPFEAELHMRLEEAWKFLKKVRAFRDDLERDPECTSRCLELSGLYNRADDGQLTGTAEVELRPGMNILVEGHYALRTVIDQLLDFNIVMLADTNELVDRKVARVQSYRGAEAATDYFWRIDLPSFRHHLSRFGCNADLIINNTDYRAAHFESPDFAKQWLSGSASAPQAVGTSAPPSKNLHLPNSSELNALLDGVFSRSTMVDGTLREVTGRALQSLFAWDHQVGEYLRVNIDSVEFDLLAHADEAIKQLNETYSGHGVEIRIGHTNAFHNVFNRKLPISIGLSISGSRTANILADVYNGFLLLQIATEAGYRRIRIDRELGQIAQGTEVTINDVTPNSVVQRSDPTRISVMTPTHFTVPEFLRGVEQNLVFTGREDENISASEALIRLVDEGGVWIHRFPKFADIDFFLHILTDIGANATKVGNYVIALWSASPSLRKSFKAFYGEWAPRLSTVTHRTNDEAEYDRILDAERDEFRRFIETECKDFVYLDGGLFCLAIHKGGSTWARIVSQLAEMLKHRNRLIRKRASQFILHNFPTLSIEVAELWDDVPPNSPAEISFESYTTISPTILAEIYLWLSLRGDRAAILAANIYDIRRESLDCRAHLRAAADKHAPVVLQSSLNALGQPEDHDGRTVHGYLKPNDGAHDLIQAAMTAARDMFLTEGESPPLFGIGLDHVDVRHDTPGGRACRFIWNSLASELVTHYVLDGSALFDASDRSPEALARSFDRVAAYAVGLIAGNARAYIYDQEVCAGELNYVGQEVEAMIPTATEMSIFSNAFQNRMRAAGLGAFNTRPNLIIGNLGTTHHVFDAGKVAVEQSKAWKDRLKRDNFVSAVLHGTTNSHPDVLARATIGCHKVNVAGDFLRTLINGLPHKLREQVMHGSSEVKTNIAKIRREMNNMSAAQARQILDSLRAHSRTVMDSISSPRLNADDAEYFRYKMYKIPEHHVDVVVDALLKRRAVEASVPVEGRLDLDYALEFSASMIEVEFDDRYRSMLDALWGEGVRHFHIDAGDGKLIPRVIDALEKVRYIKEYYPGAQLHAHLMVENPHIAEPGYDSVIQAYASAGCCAIAVHENAFANPSDMLSAISIIRDRGARPGLVIETSHTISARLLALIRDAELDWVLVMGVPIGYGGQIFDMSALNRISALYHFARNEGRKLLIEVDGGLTLETVRLCRKRGAQIFAGWSIIRDETVGGTRDKVRAVHGVIR